MFETLEITQKQFSGGKTLSEFASNNFDIIRNISKDIRSSESPNKIIQSVISNEIILLKIPGGTNHWNFPTVCFFKNFRPIICIRIFLPKVSSEMYKYIYLFLLIFYIYNCLVSNNKTKLKLKAYII